MLFKGLCTAIVTPFTEDLKQVNYELFKTLIDKQIEGGAKAIVFFGTTGEASTLTKQEKIEITKFAVDYCKGRVAVIVGSGGNNTLEVIENSKTYESLGVDGLLIVTPYYNKASQLGLIKHYTLIADSVNIPIILYNVPARTGVNLKPETVLTLSRHPNIVGIKEASGNLSQIMEIRRLCSDDFAIYSGDDGLILPILSIGGIGVISVLSNVLPKETNDICEYFFNGEIDKSKDLQLKLLPLINALFSEVNPIPVKNALDILGFDVGGLRLPLCKEMSDENYLNLKQILSTF